MMSDGAVWRTIAAGTLLLFLVLRTLTSASPVIDLNDINFNEVNFDDLRANTRGRI
jgi:hypothetical protein